MATFQGTSANDTILGTSDNDTQNGGGGDDLLYGSMGADVLNGGEGQDTVLYTGSYSPHEFSGNVYVDLSSPSLRTTFTPEAVFGGEAEGDQLSSIENVWGSIGTTA